MTKLIEIHDKNPQARLISQVVASVRAGGLIVYPTDSGYALGCHLGDKKALERIRRIRKLDKDHNFTLVCRDLSELAIYARVDNQAFRLLKNNTPGPYTFILRASSEVPNRLQHPKRKTIGIRVPQNPIAMSLLESLGEPLMSTSLIMPNEKSTLADPAIIFELLEGQVDIIIDGGFISDQPTTVVDLTDGISQVIRHGAGNPENFE